MKKVILEDIENMKYLLGYKRGIVVSEQSTPVAAPTTAVPAATTTTPVTPETPVAPTTPPPTNNTQPIKMGVKNPRVQVLQQLLNDKFQSGLIADGLYGPKTANAIYKNIAVINKLQLKPSGTDLKPAGVGQLGAPTTKGTETSTQPASMTTTLPTSNFPIQK
jgi:peptidoglycan hydrolase-like protein with peptidoglycan-binding domain